jgi:hypothetical protein
LIRIAGQCSGRGGDEESKLVLSESDLHEIEKISPEYDAPLRVVAVVEEMSVGNSLTTSP